MTTTSKAKTKTKTNAKTASKKAPAKEVHPSRTRLKESDIHSISHSMRTIRNTVGDIHPIHTDIMKTNSGLQNPEQVEKMIKSRLMNYSKDEIKRDLHGLKRLYKMNENGVDEMVPEYKTFCMLVDKLSEEQGK